MCVQATSSLDSGNIAVVEEAISKVSQGRTVLQISHDAAPNAHYVFNLGESEADSQ